MRTPSKNNLAHAGEGSPAPLVYCCAVVACPYDVNELQKFSSRENDEIFPSDINCTRYYFSSAEQYLSMDSHARQQQNKIGALRYGHVEPDPRYNTRAGFTQG